MVYDLSNDLERSRMKVPYSPTELNSFQSHVMLKKIDANNIGSKPGACDGTFSDLLGVGVVAGIKVMFVVPLNAIIWPRCTSSLVELKEYTKMDGVPF